MRTHAIQMLGRDEALMLARQMAQHNHEWSSDKVIEVMMATANTWVAINNEGEVAAMWGVIPPTILSDSCYLWLVTTPALEGNEFRFGRHSQMVIENILKQYPRIIGHVQADQEKSIKWLKWLKAEFGETSYNDGVAFIAFQIRSKHG